MPKVSLGCGKNPEDGYIGLDNTDFGWNKIWDAEKDPIPFGESEVDFIKGHNFFEHIERKFWRHLFNECHRVLKPNGVLEMIVPDAEVSMALALQDITHVGLWIKGTFKYLTGERPRNADYGFKRWEIIRLENGNEANGLDPRVIFAQIKPVK